MSVSSIVDESGAKVTIQVSDRFDFSTHRDFMKAYRKHPKGEMKFVVDLKQTEYLDSSAMGMLLQLREHAVKKPRNVVLLNANDAVRDILRIANFHKLFVIE
jgi:anti-anti-sigma factor